MPLITNLDRPDFWFEQVAQQRNFKHDVTCICQQCNSTPVTCVLCRNEFRYINGLNRHIAQFHYRSKESATRSQIKAKIKRRELIPDGLGYLEKLFVHEDKKHVDTKHISEFAEHLKDLLGYTKISRARQILNRATLQALKEDPNGYTTVNLKVPNKYLLPAYQIWEISGAHPNFIALAFWAYGISHAAHELRKYPVMPEVPMNPGKKLRDTDPGPKKGNDEPPTPPPEPKKDRAF